MCSEMDFTYEEWRRKRRKIYEEGKIVAGGRSEATLALFARVPP